MKQISLLMVSLLLMANMAAKELGVLPSVINPVFLKVWAGKLFISERSTVAVFNLSDLQPLARFGKEGEGPGEFKLGHGANSIVMDVNDRHIVVNSAVRVALFDHQGIFEKQVNVAPMMRMVPFGEGFISQAMIKGEGDKASQWIALFDAQGNRSKALFNSGVSMGMGVNMQVPPHFYGFRVTSDRAVVVTGQNQPQITLYRLNGDMAGEIKLPGEGQPVSADFKRQVEQFYQKDARYKNFWNYLKQYMVFPERFPPVRDMLVDSGRIYLLSHGQQDGRYSWTSVDFKGQGLEKMLLPAQELSVLELAPYDIYQSTYYYLASDEEGAWHLHAEAVKK